MSDVDRDPDLAPEAPEVTEVPEVTEAAEPAEAPDAAERSEPEAEPVVADTPVEPPPPLEPPSAEEIAAMAAATAAAVPLSSHLDVTGIDASVDAAFEAARKPSRRSRVGRVLGRGFIRLGSLVMTLALLVGGVALGGLAFERTQPPPPPVGDQATGGIAAPAVVRELADALATNNADSLRSAVSGDPYRLLAGELQSWDVQGVTSVETLATMQDGIRSATEIVISGHNAAGNPIVLNLVVHVEENHIVNFR